MKLDILNYWLIVSEKAIFIEQLISTILEIYRSFWLKSAGKAIQTLFPIFKLNMERIEQYHVISKFYMIW